ncbi:MAG: hypothetical protein U0636_00885 [Phycisphaerales bacterium]
MSMSLVLSGLLSAALGVAGPPAPCPYVTTVAGGPVYCGPFQSWQYLYPQGISDSGFWAGYRWQCGDNDSHTMAIAWTPGGGVRSLPVPAGTEDSVAWGINSSGTAVGYGYTTSGGAAPGHWASFVWPGDGGWFEIPVSAPVTAAYAFAVNNAGWVAGQVSLQPGAVASAPFVWKDGQLTVIDPAQFGKTSGIARGVSDSGWVVGSMGNTSGSTGRAFRWKDGVAEVLQPLPGAVNSVGWAVSEAGVVVGNCRFSGGVGGSTFHQIATVWPLDGSPMALESPASYNSTGAWDISEDGTILGEAGQPTTQGLPPYSQLVWILGVPYALEDVGLSPNQATAAVAMNQRGQIVGYGAIPDTQAGSAWMVTPTGVPADLNHDCVVDGADLVELLQMWGPAESSPADFNRDGVVDGTDLGMLLGDWTPQ